MKYFESKTDTSCFRKGYLDSVIAFSIQEHPKIKTDIDFVNELGYPLTKLSHEEVIPEKTLLSKEDGFSIFRYTFTFEGVIKMSGLLFEKEPNKPLVLMQHGYLGTPELIGNIYEDRSSSNYNDPVKRLMSFGVNVFCPQTLMWSIDNYGVEYNRPELDSALRKVNSSLFAVELYCLKEIIHYFYDKYPYIDMFGMSYGALYTYYVGLLSNELHSLFACSYIISTMHFPESVFPTWLGEIIKQSYNSNNLYIALGEQDDIRDNEKIDIVLKSLKDNKNVKFYQGDHEFIKDDIFLKNII